MTTDPKSETEKEADRWADRLNWVHTEYDVDGSGTESGDALDVIEAEIKQALNVAHDRAVLDFAEKILHGDEQHRAWLKEAAQAYCDGLPLPRTPAPSATSGLAEEIAKDIERYTADDANHHDWRPDYFYMKNIVKALRSHQAPVGEDVQRDAERYRWHATTREGKRGVWCGDYHFMTDEETDECVAKLKQGES